MRKSRKRIYLKTTADDILARRVSRVAKAKKISDAQVLRFALNDYLERQEGVTA